MRGGLENHYGFVLIHHRMCDKKIVDTLSFSDSEKD